MSYYLLISKLFRRRLIWLFISLDNLFTLFHISKLSETQYPL